MRVLRRVVGYLWLGLLLSSLLPLPGAAQEGGGLPAPETITIQPPLVYQGATYTVEYTATGDWRDPSAKLLYVGTPEFLTEHGIQGLVVRKDGQPIWDEVELREVLTVYAAAYLLYERPPGEQLGSVPPGFGDDVAWAMQSPSFAVQQAKALFSGRYEEAAEALRAMLVVQSGGDEVRHLAQGVRQGVAQGKDVLDALDWTLEAVRFSNERVLRQLRQDILQVFKDWRPVTEQASSYINIGGGRRLELANGLDVIELGVELLYLAQLDQERAGWLKMYLASFVEGEAALDGEQLLAARLVLEESYDAWRQRAGIILSFARDSLVDAAWELGAKELARQWAAWSWQTFGKRTVGHLVSGAAAAVGLGLTLGDLLYGLDDMYHNLVVAQRADELRRRFQAGRLAVQYQASDPDRASYDGQLAAAFLAAYLLELLAGAQAQRSYADAVDTGLLGLLGWREAAQGLRQLAAADEVQALRELGYPASLSALLALTGPVIGSTWLRLRDGMVMVYVPEGEFLMGSSPEQIEVAFELCERAHGPGECKREWFEHETPQHRVYLDAYWIDRTEVTNA